MQQGEYGEMFVQTMATAAGLLCSKPWPDRDGTDLILGASGDFGPTRSPRIEVQVKTWSNPRGTEQHWRYGELRAKHFNKLAGGGFHIPRFLILVIVPVTSAAWVDVSRERMSLTYAAYWVSLADRAPVRGRDPNSRVTVSVPRANLLDTGSLLALFEPAAAAGRTEVMS